MRTDDLWLLTICLWLGLVWLMPYLVSGVTSVSRGLPLKPQTPQPLTPRPESDCPECRTPSAITPRLQPAPPPAPPWPQVKSRRGRKKAISTEGYACHEPDCQYRLITDSRVHALVADGRHGHDHLQDFRCQACPHKFSMRRDTALYRLRTPLKVSGLILALLAEGFALDALHRVCGMRETTLRLWLRPCPRSTGAGWPARRARRTSRSAAPGALQS